MKKTIFIFIIIAIMLLQLLTNSCVLAVGTNDNIEIQIIKQGQAKYTYDENAVNYKILKSNNRIIYSLFENKDEIDSNINSSEICANENILVILQNGYPFKTKEDLNCLTDDEAYLATQEAINVILHDKDIQLYAYTDDSGKRIIDATTKIIENVQKDIESSTDLSLKEGIELKALTGWVQSFRFPGYKNKDFRIDSDFDIKSISITLEGGDGAKIVETSGEEKTTFANGDMFHVLIPNETDQHLRLKLIAKQIKKDVYLSNNTSTPEKKYAIIEESEVDINKIITVKSKNVSTIKIVNKDINTKYKIQGNTFELIDTEFKNSISEQTTNSKGEIIIPSVPEGKYYIRQTGTNSNYAQSNSLININIDGLTQVIEVEILSSKENIKENIVKDEKIVVQDKTNTYVDKTIQDVTNIVNTNEVYENVKETNETTLNNINYFNNNISRKDTTKLKRINNYSNETSENNIINKMLDSENFNGQMTRKDFMNYMDLVKMNSMDIPSLPEACK